ncbi:MMPL family transporter [Neobacillus sp. LXY-1]|uniref:MMPL family transporter n=1 Tax=Neobacillus sp. LXY-1 TaxID=3379133 RepID=UPI003EE0171E
MQKFGILLFQYRKWVVGIWLFFIVILGYFALHLPTVLSGNGFEYRGQYNLTRQVLERNFNQPKSTIILLFEKEKSASSSDFHTFINQTFNRIDGFDQAKQIITPSPQNGMMKGNFAYGLITFDKKSESLSEEITELKKRLHNRDGFTVTLTGEPIIVKDLNSASQQDLAKAEMIGLPIALIVLILAFGGLVAAALPLVIGVVSILTTMGIVYFFSYKLDLTIFILNIVPMIGLALSIDFALLFINRYKEEIKTNSILNAIKITVATAGRSIIFSALCVFIGLSGLWFIQIDIFQNVALGGMTVVFLSALCALTFLPALLALLGKNINKFSFVQLSDQKNNLWHRFAELVMRRPVIMSASALIILLIGLSPVKQMILAIPGTDSLPPNYPSRIALKTFKDQFEAKDRRDEKKVTIVLQSVGEMAKKTNLEQAIHVIQQLERDKLVSYVDSPFSATGMEGADQFVQLTTYGDQDKVAPLLEHYIRENKMRLDVFLKADGHSSKARQWVSDWSKKDLGMKASFGGSIKFEQEIFSEIIKKTPYGLLLIVVSTLIILMAAFRSVLIPLKAILMNILSLGCTFGIVVWIFQLGHFGIKPVNIGLILPVFVFTLVFGLSMDYEVFLISRIQEHYLETGNNSLATIEGLTKTSKIITSAAAIMIVVTGAFAFTGVMPIKQLGVGIAVAIFIDATIVRMVLVPALMKLLGDWNWWFFGLKNTQEIKHRKKPA